MLMNTHRLLSDHAWLPKNHTWVTPHGHGYCTDCARERAVKVMKMRALPDDVCDGCLKALTTATLR